MVRLRRYEYSAGTGIPGPWVVLNPSVAVSGVHVENVAIHGVYSGTVVHMMFLRAPIRSTFLQRAALARHLSFNHADKRLVWVREHEMINAREFIPVGLEVSVAVGQDQALFFALVGERESFEAELFGFYFK